MGGRRLTFDVQELLLELGDPRAAGDRPGGPARRRGGQGRGHVGENNHHQPLQRPGFVELLETHIHELRAAVRPDLESAQHHAFLFPERLLEAIRQFVAQTFAGHGKNVQVGLAGGGFQVFARPSADVEQVALITDQHGGGGILLHNQLLRQRLKTGRRPARGTRLETGRRPGGKGRGKRNRLRPQDGFFPPVGSRGASHRGKKIGEIAHRLRAALKQDATGSQAVVKQRDQLFLHFRGKINQQVPAAQDVELGEGRVHDEILRRKNDHFANLFAHPVAVILLGEEPLEPCFRQVRGDVGQKEARAGLVNGVPVEVGGKDLDRDFSPGPERLHRLLEHDGQGIGFFAGGAAGHPRAQRLTGRTAREQRGQGVLAQVFPGRGVAEKVCHSDQQFLEEQIQFLRVLLQVADIGRHLADLVKAHAALDPAIECVPLVEGKVVAGVVSQQDDHLSQRAQTLVFRPYFRSRDERGTLQVGQDFPRQFRRRSHDVRQPGVNRAARHGFEFCRRRFLHQHHPGLFLDGAQPERAVGTHAGENHVNAVVLPVLRQGAEEKINGQAQPARRHRFEQVQHPVQDGHVLVRRDEVNTVRSYRGLIPDLHDAHVGGALQQLVHDSLVRRVQVLDDDKRHAAALGHAPQELFQGFESAGGGADADNRERNARRRGESFRTISLGGLLRSADR